MIIATFNVENLFERPRAMNLASWSAGQPALDAASELNALFNRRVYTPADKRKMLHRLAKYGLLAARSNNPYLSLRKIRGALLERKKGRPPRIIATGRDSWTGWIELRKEPIADPPSPTRLAPSRPSTRTSWCWSRSKAGRPFNTSTTRYCARSSTDRTRTTWSSTATTISCRHGLRSPRGSS